MLSSIFRSSVGEMTREEGASRWVGLLQAGPLVELGFPCWKNGAELACGQEGPWRPGSTCSHVHVEMATLHILWFGDGEKSGAFNPCQSSPSTRKQDPFLPCRLACVTGSQKPPLLCLATVLTLAEEWLPSNPADILQIAHNGTFHSSSRYSEGPFFPGTQSAFPDSAPGAGKWRRRLMNRVFLEAGKWGQTPGFLMFIEVTGGQDCLEVSLHV